RSTITREVAQKMVAEAEQRENFHRWLMVGLMTLALTLGALFFFVLRDLIKTLRHTVNELSAGGEQVASASGQIASTSQSLSQGASEQAASIEEVSASM